MQSPSEQGIKQNGAEKSMNRLAKLAACADRVVRTHLVEHEDLEDWVHPCGRMVVLGDAAHSAVPGMVQASAMELEDAAVLAKLFSHARRRVQIPQLLSAFCSLRARRSRDVLAAERANVAFMTMPYVDPQASGRDAAFRWRAERGWNVLDSGDDNHVAAGQWEQIREMWAYGAYLVHATAFSRRSTLFSPLLSLMLIIC
jgi:salicylate hydroxylase